MFGDYTCIAMNRLGRLQRVVTLSEGAKPGVPRIEIKNIQADSAVLKIEVLRVEVF